MPNKKVTIAVEVDSTFVRLLNAECELSRWRDEDRQVGLTAGQALCLAALAEARGGTEAEVHALIPHEWRPHLRVVHEHREVVETSGAVGEGAPSE